MTDRATTLLGRIEDIKEELGVDESLSRVKGKDYKVLLNYITMLERMVREYA